ncbi:MAG: hypothetical protein ACI9LM_004913 [Alteromonadaceae bacterium]|jgi:hypothetical protein
MNKLTFTRGTTQRLLLSLDCKATYTAWLTNIYHIKLHSLKKFYDFYCDEKIVD